MQGQCGHVLPEHNFFGRCRIVKISASLVCFIHQITGGNSGGEIAAQIGVFMNQIGSESQLAIDYALLAGARFFNILDNAIKFSPRDRKITLELRQPSDTMHIEIVVTDEGQGFRAEDLPLMYGKFQKLSARPTGGEISTGLGLSVTKEFVEILRGGISCQSTWGEGTTFIVSLPRGR